MATSFVSQRQRGRLGSLGRSSVAATLLHEREFRQSGGPCGCIVAATLLREREFRQSGDPCGRIVAATLLRERPFRRRGSPCCCLVALSLISEATARLDEREVRWRVVGLSAATFVGQRVPEALHVSLMATALVGQCRPNALFDSGFGQRCRTCCGSRETLLLGQRGANGAFLLVSQSC